MTFESATRLKYRYPSSVGMISTEDLWDLSDKQLDGVYKKLNSEIKKVTEESLLTTTSDADKELTDKLAIVKHIFTVKSAEQEDRVKSKERSEKKQYLLSLLQQKQDETYKSKSVEELQALIDAL